MKIASGPPGFSSLFMTHQNRPDHTFWPHLQKNKQKIKTGWTTHSWNNAIWLAVSPCHMTMMRKINKLEKPIFMPYWQISYLLWSFLSGCRDVRVVHPHISIICVIGSLIFILELLFEKVCGDSNSPNTNSTTRRHVGKKNFKAAHTENAIYAKYRPSYHAPNFNPLTATSCLVDRAKIRNFYANVMQLMFADNTNLFPSYKNIDAVFDSKNVKLANFSMWFKSNKLSLDVDKTKWLLFYPCKHHWK